MVALSLNAQDYTNEAVLFHYYVFATLSHATPASGPAVGSTGVVVAGLGLVNHTALVACRFGGFRVPATILGGGLARCIAPDAVSAQAGSRIEVRFGADKADAVGASPVPSLRGSATVENDGAVSLTPNDYHQVGSVLLSAAHPVAQTFHVSFDVYVGDGSGGEGFSFCYGQPLADGAVGARGVDSGLCVRFRTRDDMSMRLESVEAAYDGTVLRTVSGEGVDSLRMQAWVPVAVARTNGGVQVRYNGRPLMERVRVDKWLPTSSWQFIWGASTTNWRDRHRIDNVRLQLGAMVDRTSIPVEITTNGDQFSDSQAIFDYFPEPTISLVLPAFSPTDGGTLVMLTGAGLFDAGAQIRCRFGNVTTAGAFSSSTSIVLASGLTNLTGHGISCRTPPQQVGEVHVSVALNGQDFAQTVGIMQVYTPPRLSSLDPLIGPSRGGSRVRLQGVGFLAGGNSTRFCNFGQLRSVPAHIEQDGEAVCIAPSLDQSLYGPEASVVVKLTLNAQDFTSDRINFTFYSETRVSHVNPTTGPTRGGTLITLFGSFSNLGVTYNCTVGSTVLISATRLAHDRLRCRTMSMAHGLHPVEVTLNGQDFSGAGTSFRAYLPPILLDIHPASGPESGGTLLTLSGRGLDEGSNRSCAFNGSLITPATVQSEALLLCNAPLSEHGLLAVGLSLNGQQYLHTSLHFRFDVDPVALTLSPGIGPVDGGTVVLIGGRYLHGGSAAYCSFGDAPPVQMMPILDSENVSCTTPPGIDGHRAPLRLTLNGCTRIHPVRT